MTALQKLLRDSQPPKHIRYVKERNYAVAKVIAFFAMPLFLVGVCLVMTILEGR